MPTPTIASPHGAAPALRRELGRWDLTAVGVNQVIGGAVFATPAALAANSGTWSPWLVALVGCASILIALSFAEVGSRFDATGGPYLYARAAFGRFAGFQVGWMAWITRVASWASVVNILAAALGFYWPVLTEGGARAGLMLVIVGVVTAINLSGIRQSALVVNALTIGKLTPLAIFIVVGLFFVDWSRFAEPSEPSIRQLSATALLLIFAFGGYENVPVPAGEARDPRRAVPFALVMTIVIVTLVMTLAQVVAFGTLPGLAASTTPLADSAALFMGAAGAAMITLGTVVSTTGNNMGGALSASRVMFALADQGDLPAWFGRVHEAFRTPVTAILISSLVALALALSGTYVALAQASAISRLIVYVATCAAALRLRQARFAGVVEPPRFVVPFGPLIPTAAIVIALAILAGATPAQLVAGVAAVAVGALLYGIAAPARRAPVAA